MISPRHRISILIFRVLLHRYPNRLREEYGEEMVEAFRRMIEEETEGAPLAGRYRAWRRVLRDLARRIPEPVGTERPNQTGRSKRARPSNPRGRERVRRGSGTLAASLKQDVLGAARSLRRAPQFTALLVGVLGVGIALNAAAYALIDVYLLRPLPYPEAHRIVRVETPTEAVSWRDTDEVFELTVSSDLDGFTLLDDGPPEVVLGAWTTPSFFQVYGVRPALGRFFASEEAGSEGRPVAVISHDLWVSRYGGDRGVLGRTLRVYSSDRRTELRSVEIIGVLPEDFWFPNGYTQVLLPMPGEGAAEVGRLRTDVPPDRAEELLTALAFERGGEDLPHGFRMEVQSLQDAHTARIRPRLVTFQIAALLVLLVAGVNAVLLVLIRATGRSRDLAVRQALGAGRGRLATHFLFQGWILGTLAAGVGVFLASQGLGTFGSVLEARLGRSVPGGTEVLALGASDWLLALGSSLVVGTLLGAMPLFVTSRAGLAGRMRDTENRTTDSTGVRRLRNIFVGAEVALSLTLLIGGALMVRSALHLETVDLGFRPDDLFAITIGQTSEGADNAADRVTFFRRLEERAAALPGVQGAGLVRSAPFSGNLTPRTIQTDGMSEDAVIRDVIPQTASPGFFESLGMEPVAGRWFSKDQALGAPPVAVVSQALADRAWPGQSPLGRRVRFPAFDMQEMTEEPGPWLRVVGVAPDIVSRIEPRPEVVYLPHAQAANAWMDLVIRSRPGAPPSPRAVQDILRKLDPDVPLYAYTSVAKAVDEARAPARFFTALLGGFSLVAFALALIGFYGVAAYAFRQRRRDVAIRVVLGADRGVLERAFLRGTLPTLLAGLILGVFGGRYLGTILQSQLHGVPPDDVFSILVVTALFAATAVLAAWIPARGAAGVDPMRVLREE